MPNKDYKVAIIGHTGRGNYGHGLDIVWKDVPKTKVVAVADADQEGLAKAIKKLAAPAGYESYRLMLEKEKPDFITIAPRWLDQHHDMVLAAAEHGVKGVYLEKPMCRTLREADEMVAACEKSGMKVALAYQNRYSPILEVIEAMIDQDQLGTILEIRGRGKDDHRGGGEDLWVLGSHVLNLIQHLCGRPEQCSAQVYQGRNPIAKEHVSEGKEGIGLLAGDRLSAMYRMENGTQAFFASHRSMRGNPSRFGLTILGSKGAIQLYDVSYLPKAYWLNDSSWSPGRTGKEWVPISSAGPEKEEPIDDGSQHAANVRACTELIRSAEENVQPETSIYDGRTTTEMVAAVFESHRLGKTVPLPLESRENPLALLRA